MLLALRIESFTVVEEVEVAFGPGLTVLTGETGAGKSILVDALGPPAGHPRGRRRASGPGAEEAVVEAVFQRTRGARPSPGGAGTARTTGTRSCFAGWWAASGRGKVHVNGALASVGVLGQLMRGELDIAGQHAHVGPLRALDPPRPARPLGGRRPRARGVPGRARAAGSRSTPSASPWRARRGPGEPGRVPPLPAGRAGAAGGRAGRGRRRWRPSAAGCRAWSGSATAGARGRGTARRGRGRRRPGGWGGRRGSSTRRRASTPTWARRPPR